MNAKETLVLSIDYSRSLEDMFAAGHYYSSGPTAKRFASDPDFMSERFPSDAATVAKLFPRNRQGIAHYEAKLVHFGFKIHSKLVVEETKRGGWELGRIEQLLAFGEKYPEVQLESPIIALGSIAWIEWHRYVALLDHWVSGSPECWIDRPDRDLSLYRWNTIWLSSCRFLAVRLLPSAT